MRICWCGRSKILADCTSSQKYKRLKKKGEKWNLCFDPQIIAGNGQNISKTFFVHVLDTLCMNLNKFFEQKQKWQNLTIFRKFLPEFTSAWKKKGEKWNLRFWPSYYENFPERCNITETSDTLQAVFFLDGVKKKIPKTIPSTTLPSCFVAWHTWHFLFLVCLTKRKLPNCFSFSSFYLYLCKTKLQPTFLFLATKPCLKLFGVQTNGHGTTLDQQGLSDSMTLAGAKEYFKKAESDLECRTDALLNKKQKKK